MKLVSDWIYVFIWTTLLGEALGAIGDKSAVPILTKYSNSDIEEIAETCQLALRKITWGATTDECLSNNPFQSCGLLSFYRF
jgi:HEAT repeat protein